MGVDLIMKSSLVRKTLDNITVLLIGFENLENFIINRNKEKDKEQRELDNYKHNTLKTEETKLKRKSSEGKDISSSLTRLETDNIISSDKIYNKTSRNLMDFEGNNSKEKKNKNKLNNFKGTTGNDFFNTNKKDKKEISTGFAGFEVTPMNENTLSFGSPKRNRIVLDRIKNDKINLNKLPPVLYTENNFREMNNNENNKNNIYRSSIYNSNTENKNGHFEKLKIFGMENSKKIPIKVISLNSKKTGNNNNNEEENNISSDNEYFEQIEENNFGNLEPKNFKSKIPQEKNKNKKDVKISWKDMTSNNNMHTD